jgi:hypothetical protein
VKVPVNSVTPVGHTGTMADRLLTPSKIAAWLDCAHIVTLEHEVEASARMEIDVRDELR